MQTRTLQITANSAASLEQVWALLADVKTWSEWGAFDESTLERPGNPQTHADVTLAPTRDGGTTISWRSSFTARWPLAPIIERRLRTFIADTAQRLGSAAQNGGKVSTTRTPRTIKLRPIGIVRAPRTEVIDDDWADTEATIALDPTYLDLSAVCGLEEFSHIEVIYDLHLVLPEALVRGARRPRDNPAWPRVGILAQRAKDRPNRLGVSRCQLLAVNGLELHVRGLDAINGTPVLDIKPYMQEFDPHGPVRQPEWTRELMGNYW